MKNKKILVVLFIGVVSIIGYYIYNGQMPNVDNFFTKYDTLESDSTGIKSDTSSLGYIEDTDETIDSLSNSNDPNNSELENFKTENISKVDSTSTPALKSKESIFQVNTSYEKINDANVIAEKSQMVSQHQVDNELFLELTLPDEDKKKTLNKVFGENTIPYNSLLKLLSQAGQNILLKEDNFLSQMIIDALADSDHISVIYIIDRKGNISYSSHKTLANSLILSSLKNIDLKTTELGINEVDGHTWISIPIFHTYGKIGNALINIF